jgi:flagellar biosynthesis/type III secretory pathway protein FliH
VRAAELGEAKPISSVPSTRRRVVPREELAAQARIGEMLETAKRDSERIVSEARDAARETAERAAKEAEEREQAKLAAAWIALRAREEKRADVDLDRAVQLATVLAERLIGAALEIDPAKAVALAKHALSEARGARRATILAHPEDAAALAARIDALGMPDGTVTVLADDSCSRGSLAIQTELGIVDARLHPQLERLAVALREALR